VQVLVVKKQSLQQDQKAVPNISFLREAALVFSKTLFVLALTFADAVGLILADADAGAEKRGGVATRANTNGMAMTSA
jgi:hypothetical protein